MTIINKLKEKFNDEIYISSDKTKIAIEYSFALDMYLIIEIKVNNNNIDISTEYTDNWYNFESFSFTEEMILRNFQSEEDAYEFLLSEINEALINAALNSI